MQELADMGERVSHQSVFFVQKDKSVDFASLVFSLNVCCQDFRKERELIPY